MLEIAVIQFGLAEDDSHSFKISFSFHQHLIEDNLKMMLLGKHCEFWRRSQLCDPPGPGHRRLPDQSAAPVSHHPGDL